MGGDRRFRLPCLHYERHMQNALYALGLVIARHPKRCIAGTLIFTALCAFGFLRFHQVNNARITFTATDAQSHRESASLTRFLGQDNGTLHMIDVLIKARDGGDLMRKAHLRQLSDLAHFLANRLAFVDRKTGQNVTYRTMCKPYCAKNQPLFSFLKVANKNFTRVDLTYPTISLLGKPVFVASNVYGVELKPNSTEILSFHTAVLHFFIVHESLNIMFGWESEIVRLFNNMPDRYSLIRGSAASDNIVAMEVRAMGTETAPLLLLVLLLLVFFLVISSFRYKASESKPIEVILGATAPLLAVATTVGMVSATGWPFMSIVVSTLFLIMAIGVDDVFLIVATWHQVDAKLTVEKRLAETVKLAGSSMVVTTVTNLVSFANGIFSTTPVLQTFSVYSCVASVICFFYQLILFPAVIKLGAQREVDERKFSCLPDKIGILRKTHSIHARIWTGLASAVGKLPIQIGVILALITYWMLSVYGLANMQTDLSIQKLVLPNRPIVKFKNEYDEAVKAMQTVGVVVSDVGDLRNKTRYDALKRMVHEFESLHFAYGPESTFFWARDFESFERFYNPDVVNASSEAFNFTSYRDLPDFVASNAGMWAPLIHLNESECDADRPTCIKEFLFTTGFTSLVKYTEVYQIVDEWRHISNNYSDLFSAAAYTERSDFAEQSQTLKPMIWQTMTSEVICMAISFLIFIPDAISIVSATFALLSVNLGVFGFLSLWGIGMDPMSVASLLMSIGFSVDISAHIMYHYYESKGESVQGKLEEAFLSVAWPTVQGAMSTFLCMAPIVVMPSYLGMVFLKTVCLVTVFGLLHGLVVLPVLLCLASRILGRKVAKDQGVDNAIGSSPSAIVTPTPQKDRV